MPDINKERWRHGVVGKLLGGGGGGEVMVRTPCCEKLGLKKGPWTLEEDRVLISYINRYGHGNWRALPKKAGLLRCGKSCRLRWTNYLRPDIKRGNFSQQEEQTIISLHQMLGNRWSAIAAKLPGRTDNEIKNVWHTKIKKRLNIHPPTKHNHKHSSESPSVLPDIPQATTSSSSGSSSELDKNIPSTGSELDHQLDESFWSETLSSLEDFDFDFDFDFEGLMEEEHVVRPMDHYEDEQCYDYELEWFHNNVINDVGEIPAAVYY